MGVRVLIVLFCINSSLFLQVQSLFFPKYYFRNPLDISMDLSANFGELRPDHWHMGLDIKTNQKENLPVYAAAAGYIAKIGIRPESFGRFIVINHPNGLSTLYGHLNEFFPLLEQYVTAQQYKNESWAIELKFTKDQFPLSKGQFIAKSGNTGGSKGPHLHFEIFDTKTEKRVNPLLFSFPITDNIPPSMEKLAMYDRSKSTYEQSPVLYSLKNTNSGYTISKLPVIKTGLRKISFAIQAYDKMNNSTSQNGIYAASIYMDSKPQIQFILDSIDYNETVYINAEIDYKFRANGGAWLQHLSKLPGDHSLIYKPINGNGVITLVDTSVHFIRIAIKDVSNNISELNFGIQHVDVLATDTNKEDTYLIPNQKNKIIKPGFEMYLPSNSVYDTASIKYFSTNISSAYAVSPFFQVNDASIPIHNAVTVRIKPDQVIPDEWKDKIIIQRIAKENSIAKKANRDAEATVTSQWYSANFGSFGAFQAFKDILPPVINDIGKSSGSAINKDTIDLSSSRRIVITPTDNFKVLKNFRAELDGQWIRFTNDKSKNWIYEFDEHCPYGVHLLKVSVEDIVGNSSVKEWWFKRYPYSSPLKGKKGIKKK